MKFLVRSPNWIGDALLAFPALESLGQNYPGAEIWVAANSWVGDIFSRTPHVKGVVSLSAQGGISGFTASAGILREGGFDSGLLLTNSFASALLFLAVRIPRRWGYRTDGRRFLLTKSVPLPEVAGPLHQVHYYLNLLRGLGLKTLPPKISLRLSPRERRGARRLLDSLGVKKEKPLVILNPGAAYGPAKRWPEERFADTAARLQKKKAADILIVGSAEETSIAEGIASRLRNKPYVLAGRTDFGTLLGLISWASVLITNDSGSMHLANALGVPVVAVFGPTDPRVTAPFQPPATVIKKEVVCWPCLYRKCPYDHRCMTAVEPEEVFLAAMDYLQ